MNVIDFFCGAGGFSEGFRQKGFKILRGYDNWQPAIDTFNHNFESNSVVKNILDFKDSIDEINELPNTDVIIGSPPCVSFSSSNISGKADKTSGILLTKIFLRIVAVKKYQRNSTLKAWFMENVANSRNYLADYYTFNDLGLGDWARQNKLGANKKAIILKENQPLINSADYGSFQARKRAISGEIINKGKLIIPSPTHSQNKNDKLPQWNTVGDLMNRFPAPNSTDETIEIFDPVYPSIKLISSSLTDHFYDSGLYESEWRQSMELKVNHYCMGKMSFPENMNKPSRTITATKCVSSREALIFKSEFPRNGNGEYRSLTLREAASIMGFPFTYQFKGTLNTKWRLVGNAVCPSVSRAFANEVLNQLGKNNNERLCLEQIPNLSAIQNLNDFKEKKFDKQPKKKKNSRFRRHPIKDGNLTVTLSNYDIEKKSKSATRWFTSIQYGNGVGYKHQRVEDNAYLLIENLIKKYDEGQDFLNYINNGFTEKIASAKELQRLYENQMSTKHKLEPTKLVKLIRDIIDNISIENTYFEQNDLQIFKHKKLIPVKQLFALYAINKISSSANQNKVCP